MSKIKRFEDVEAWKAGRELTAAAYRATNSAVFRDDRALRDQIRRAAVSIVSNIAEGFDRNGSTELKQYLAIAKGSAAELKAQLYVALDAGYLDRAQFDHMYRRAGDVQNLLGGFLRYLSTSPLRGSKYHPDLGTRDSGPGTSLAHPKSHEPSTPQ